MSQTGLILAISLLVGIACGGLLWFGTDLTMKLHATLMRKRAERAPAASAEQEPADAGKRE